MGQGWGSTLSWSWGLCGGPEVFCPGPEWGRAGVGQRDTLSWSWLGGGAGMGLGRGTLSLSWPGGPGWGVLPLAPSEVTKEVKTLPSLILRTRAVIAILAKHSVLPHLSERQQVLEVLVMDSIIVTDRVRSTRWEVIVSLCLSVHTCGGTPARSRWGGEGTPAWSSQVPTCQTWPGVPCQGVPHLGYPCSCQVQAGCTPARSSWGVPHLGYPHQTWPEGYPAGGYPTLGTPFRPGQGYPSSSTPSPIRPDQGMVPLPARSRWGVPQPGPPWVPPLPSDLVRGYPCWGGYPTSGNRWSTWYSAVGMSLSCFKITTTTTSNILSEHEQERRPLLNVLAGRIANYSGKMTVNNYQINKQIRRKMGYVLQQDIFFNNLTLEQTLTGTISY